MDRTLALFLYTFTSPPALLLIGGRLAIGAGGVKTTRLTDLAYFGALSPLCAFLFVVPDRRGEFYGYLYYLLGLYAIGFGVIVMLLGRSLREGAWFGKPSKAASVLAALFLSVLATYPAVLALAHRMGLATAGG